MMKLLETERVVSTPRSIHVHYIILDISDADVPPAAHQMALRNLMQAIRKFFHIMAIPEETNTPCKWMYSILLVSNGNAEV